MLDIRRGIAESAGIRVVLPKRPNPNTRKSALAMAKLRLASNRNSMIGSFSRISHTTVAIHPITPIASIQQMKELPNQSSIWPRSNATSNAADAKAISAMPMPSICSLPFVRTEARSASKAGGSFSSLLLRKKRQEADRNIDEEYPAPTVVVRDPAAKDWPDGGGRHDHDRVESECRRAFRRRKCVHQYRLRNGRQSAARQALAVRGLKA